MIAGDHVRRHHSFDGSSQSGKPIGPQLTVVRIEDYRPEGREYTRNAIAHLSDGTQEFVWNLDAE